MKSFYLNIFFLLTVTVQSVLFSQVNTDSQTQYMIGGITFSGNSTLEENTILSLINLNVGDNIFVPGEEIKNGLKTLWDQNLFSDIQIFQTKTEENLIFLEIYLEELPKLEKFQFKGLKKSEIDKLRDELNLIKGISVGKQIRKKTKNHILKHFREKGYFNVECEILEEFNQTLSSSILIIDVKKNDRVKIKEIVLTTQEQRF